MNYIFSIETLKRAIEEIIPKLPQAIPYLNDRDDIFRELYINYDVELPFKKVFSIVTQYCIAMPKETIK